MKITVTFETDDANTALPGKVIAGVETMLNERGLDMHVHPTTGGMFHDLTVTVTDQYGAPIWGSVFDGAANNETDDDTEGTD
jgi:hypothetical protein